MLQDFVAAAAPHAAPDDPGDPMLHLAGAPRHALIIANGAPGLMCGLLRRGCSAVAVIRPGEKPEAEAVDLVIAAKPVDPEGFDRLIRFARRYLVIGGGLMATVSGMTAATMLARRLRLNGFSAPRLVRATSGGIVLRADRRGGAA